jgi:hypothetical protein
MGHLGHVLQKTGEVHGGSPEDHPRVQEVQGYDNGSVREFSLILRAAIKGARTIGRIYLLINDQTVPKIMAKMPFTDWKEWDSKRPEWARGNLGAAFEAYVKRKWKDALNVAAAETQGWETDRGRKDKVCSEKPAWGKPPGEKPTGIVRRTSKLAGAANVVTL